MEGIGEMKEELWKLWNMVTLIAVLILVGYVAVHLLRHGTFDGMLLMLVAILFASANRLWRRRAA